MPVENHRAIPSMYHRRLRLIAGVMLIVFATIVSQLFRLTVVHGSSYRTVAKSALQRRSFLPTYRGVIHDRHGRVLAADDPGYAIAVPFDVISGRWAWQEARRRERDAVGRTAWGELSDAVRSQAISRRLPETEAEVEHLWSEVCRIGEIDHGELLERLDTLRRTVQRRSAVVEDAQRRNAVDRYGADGAESAFIFEGIRESTIAHPILESVSDEVAFTFERLREQLPADIVEVQYARNRQRPNATKTVTIDRSSLPRAIRHETPITLELTDVAGHIVGAMREVYAEDVERRPFIYDDAGVRRYDLKGYRGVNDAIGAFGLESTQEDQLRGTRGEVIERLDSNEVIRTDPTPGRDVRATIDIELQARIEAVLSPEIGLTRVQPYHANELLPPGHQLNAAAVVLEIATGEILAMASMPSWSMAETMSAAEAELRLPRLNRVTQATYTPGSIVKPLVLTAAIHERQYVWPGQIECRGHFRDDRPNELRCWIFREQYGFLSHGEQDAIGALARSCNIFFYTLGERLGPDRLLAWYRRYGAGTPLVTGLGMNAGIVPERSNPGEAIMMGIGQGPIAWTPLHAANAYATLARGGTRRDATIIADPDRPTPPDVPISSQTLDLVLAGLRQTVEATHGSAHHLRYEDGLDPIITARGVTVWAKTGTAQTGVPLVLGDTNRNGKIDDEDERVRGLSHAWFVGLLGPDDTGQPMYVLSVIVEYGGSGGRVSGPIANQIILALQHEGYLPDAGPVAGR